MIAPSKTRDDTRNLNLLGFVGDAGSEGELTRFLKTTVLGSTQVERGSIETAIQWLKRSGNHSPQRLLVDISGITNVLDELDRLANVCEPSVQVYVVGDRNDVGLYRSLLQRGVQDYIVKPISAELLRRSLGDGSDAASAVRQVRNGRVVAISGARGGVGVTSVAAHLARELASEGGRRRVAYVDLNLYDGNGASLLGLAGGNALVEVLGNVNHLDPQYLERTLNTRDNRLYALCAELEYSESFVPDGNALADLLNVLGQHFHYIILDVPESGGALANEAYANASLACIIADQTVHSARTLIRLMRHIQGRNRPPTTHIVLNQSRAPARGAVHTRDFTSALEWPVAVSIPFDAQAPLMTENLGDPLPARSDFGRGVRALAALLTGEGATAGKRAPQSQGQGGLFARLRGARS
ncbi:AAA family ATPase [uncultured Castellaniella sp.]|uniref:AAA family ATPase n=1 Tax=uncultured Castellaniella sp. TaxID=647907 RepID=UPI002628B899|nr:AAA family ATPase [uncultured Castellaniella sp.]